MVLTEHAVQCEQQQKSKLNVWFRFTLQRLQEIFLTVSHFEVFFIVDVFTCNYNRCQNSWNAFQISYNFLCLPPPPFSPLLYSSDVTVVSLTTDLFYGAAVSFLQRSDVSKCRVSLMYVHADYVHFVYCT